MKKIAIFLSILLFMGTMVVNAQTRTITGTVTSAEDGEPIPGVSILVKGTSLGTVTDIDGKYSLKVPQNAETLVFSFVGMKNIEVELGGTQSSFDVKMESDVMGLNEVLVVAYGTATKASFSGAVSKVDEKAITSGNTQSVDKALVGKIAGVRISSTTGAPGASGEVQIRGVGSVNASTQPLYIVDGVPMHNGDLGPNGGMSQNVLSTLNPEDIASVTVLKDAAAASLYGSRAANGVIVITTKRGKSGQTKFNFKVEAGWSKIGSDSYEMMNADQYLNYAKKSLVGYYLYNNNALYPTDANFGNAAVNSDAETYAENNFSSYIKDQGADTNWRDIIYDTGHKQTYQFSTSGGNEKTTFYASLGYTLDKGIVMGSKFDRLSGKLALDHKAFDWLSFGIDQSIAKTKIKGYSDQSDQAQGIGYASPLGVLFAQNPTAPRYLSDGSVNTGSSIHSYIPYPDEALSGDGEFTKNKTFRNTTNGYVKVNILPELSVKSTAGVDWLYNEYFVYWSPESTDGEALNGYGYKLNGNRTVFTTSTVANYVKTFNDVHNLSALAGFETEDIDISYINAEAKNYSTPKLPELSNGQPSDAGSSKSSSTMLSYFGNVNYNYASKYYLGVSVRSDGSSRLGKDNRWATFYSVSGSWRLKQENFLEDNSSIDELKIRASYGTTGTLPPGYYQSLGLYSFSEGYGSESAIALDQPQNLDLSWEKSSNFNVGVDIGVFNRLSMTVEYYHKTTKDLLLDVPTSYLTAFSESLQNVGEIENKGIEIEIHSDNIKHTNGFKWSTDLNFSTLKTEVTSLPNHSDIIAGDGNLYMYREGEDMYSFYLPKYYGVDPTCGLAQFYIDPDAAPTTDNLTYSYGEASRGVVAKAIPDVTGGLTNTFSFKGFEFSVLLSFQFGGNLFDYPGYFTHHDGLRMSVFNLAADVADNYWTEAGDEVDNPLPIYSNSLRPDKWSTRHIKSTDNVRIRELALRYSFPKAMMSSINVERLSLFFKTNNLAFVWRETDGIDPDVPLNGYRTVDTPVSKTFQFGLSVDF